MAVPSSFYVNVPSSYFQSSLSQAAKLGSLSSMRARSARCVLLQCSGDIKWEKADKKKCKRATWHKKLGVYSTRSWPLINSSLIDDTVHPVPAWKFHIASPHALYTFMRPYTFIATVLGIMSSSLMAVETLNDISFPFFIGIMQSIFPSLCLNGYSSAINQIFDLEIDKVNKPHLPLASGEISYAMAIAIASACVLTAFGTAYAIGSTPLCWAIFLNSCVTSVYSINLPFLRWKRSAVTATICVLVARALVAPSAIYLHMQTFIFKRSANCPRSLMCGIIVLSLFFVVAALFKDIPDIEGDIKHGINSLASRLGKRKVFWICIYLVQMGYAVAVVFAGATAAPLWRKIIAVLSHAVLSSNLWKRANAIDLRSEDALKSFYTLIWKLIYIEYLLIPLLK